jgi:hypothetical protein
MGQLIVDPIPKCAYVDSNSPDTNYGSSQGMHSQYVRSGKQQPEVKQRTIMDADLSSVPVGSTIQPSSKLELYVYFVRATWPCTLHRVAQPAWTENGVTWNAYDGVNDWASPGGDYSTPAVPFTFPSATGWLTITGADLAAFLQDALDNRAGIARMLIRVDAESGSGKGGGFRSDDAEPPYENQKPKLTIDYAVPGVPGARGYPWAF